MRSSVAMGVDWKTVRHFGRHEWQKDPDKVDPDLVRGMDLARSLSGVPAHIHVAFDPADGHSSTSLHYEDPARAVDFHFAEGLTPLEEFLILSAVPAFGGFGYYPFWDNPGWHVDLRNPETRVYWVRDKFGKYHYGWRALARALAA